MATPQHRKGTNATVQKAREFMSPGMSSSTRRKIILVRKNWDSLKDMVSPGFDRAYTLRFILNCLNDLVKQNKAPPAEHERSNQTKSGNSEDHHDEEGVNNTNEEISTQESDTDGEGGETQTDGSTPESLDDAVAEDSEEDNTTQDVTAPSFRRSKRLKLGPDHWKNTRVYYNNQVVAHPIQVYYSVAHLPAEHQVFLSKIDQETVPTSYERSMHE